MAQTGGRGSFTAAHARARAERARRPLRTLLDAACGTGLHLQHLRDRFEVEGFDLDEGMLAVARDRLPGVPLHRADLAEVDLGRRFDVVAFAALLLGVLAGVVPPEQAFAGFGHPATVTVAAVLVLKQEQLSMVLL